MKKLPIGLQNFQEIIQTGFLYVDKTKAIHHLLSEGKLYFLSRPRRFGKTLLISTLKNIFRGNKKLFKDLYISQKTDWKWPVHPVLSFNFASFGHQITDLDYQLKRLLQEYATQYNLTLPPESLSVQLRLLVQQIAQKEKAVVILVDEYDKPIIDFLTEKDQANKNSLVLRQFFSPLKDLEQNGYLRFLFITGVSKFARVSIFSDLNNLVDLTVKRTTADLTGITQTELLENFDPFIKRSTEELDFTRTQLLKWLKIWYNGYSWDGKTFVYNPYSLLNFFSDSRFGNFWFATGTPTFLMKTIQEQRIRPIQLDKKEFLETFFDKFSIEQIDIYNLLFQTGYLTIKSVKFEDGELRYKLGYPNREVQQSFIYNLLESFTNHSSNVIGDVLLKMRDALREGQVNIFIEQLQILLSDISYHLMPRRKKNTTTSSKNKAFDLWEGYFQTIIYLVSSFLNFTVQTELTKHKGRLDLLIDTAQFLYLMELKLDEPAKNAIAQIKSRQYAQSYKNTPKTVLLVGIEFSKKDRNIASWEVETWK